VLFDGYYYTLTLGIDNRTGRDGEIIDSFQDKESGPGSSKVTEGVQELLSKRIEKNGLYL